MNQPNSMRSRILEFPKAAQTNPALTALRAGGVILAGTLFLALCAHVSIPLFFTPVPLTVQPFAVLALGLLLEPRMALATLVTYLAEGALGLPVFAPSALSGLAHLFGPTGGYLLAYPFAAALISLLFRHGKRGFTSALIAAAAGDALILTLGAAWLALFTHGSASTVFTSAVLLFLPGDVLKVAAAAGIAAGANRLRRSN